MVPHEKRQNTKKMKKKRAKINCVCLCKYIQHTHQNQNNSKLGQYILQLFSKVNDGPLLWPHFNPKENTGPIIYT